ncbi:DUF2625 domain-containing protein [Pantoea sp. DY-15]|uniref:DUF2625 family protein n=1 Tax=Pantoea sp. DY-15 TaxID=2871489 RepID=UPI001C9653B6|nr:DUF2625 family protein [Pantoea sp. DY-15]MBY4890628.1 DUF2625 domain-containing protein [Pantoea sp. DY-15]
MRDMTELIDQHRSGWMTLQQDLKGATNRYDVLPSDPELAAAALLQLQVTTFSSLGAVIYETGGILIDDGWLRILGSGHPKLPRSLASGTQSLTTGQAFNALLIADDVSGGFFALNGGEFGKNTGDVYYFAPDSLEWESLDTNYSGFLSWALTGDLERFYESVRWKEWREDTSLMSSDAMYSFYPFLWTEHQLAAEQRSRAVVPVSEQWLLCQQMQNHLNNAQGN